MEHGSGGGFSVLTPDPDIVDPGWGFDGSKTGGEWGGVGA